MKTFRRILGFICLAISLFCAIMVVRFYVSGGKDVPVNPSNSGIISSMLLSGILYLFTISFILLVSFDKYNNNSPAILLDVY